MYYQLFETSNGYKFLLMIFYLIINKLTKQNIIIDIKNTFIK